MKSSNNLTKSSQTFIQDLQRRLYQEIDEREAEAAVYSSKLFELEKEKTDWSEEKYSCLEHMCFL